MSRGLVMVLIFSIGFGSFMFVFALTIQYGRRQCRGRGRRCRAARSGRSCDLRREPAQSRRTRACETTKLINQNRRRRQAPDNNACTVPARQQPGSCTADSINPAADQNRNRILIARTHQLTRPNVRPARSPAYLNSITTAIPEQRF
jgi:hypothetical protein